MRTECDQCAKVYDDELCWTICPHPSLEGPPPRRDVAGAPVAGSEEILRFPLQNVFREISAAVEVRRVDMETALQSGSRKTARMALEEWKRANTALERTVQLIADLQGVRKEGKE